MEKRANKIAENAVTVDMQFRGLFVTEFWVKMIEEFIKLDSETKGGFKNYTFEVTCINNASVPDNMVNIQVHVKVFLDAEKKNQLGFLSLSNLFFVKDLKQFVDEANNIYRLPEPLEVTLISISLSHSRAILLAKCAGTFLQNAVLPIMNPKAFVKRQTNKKM